MHEVTIIDGESRIGTFLLADGLDRRHQVITELIERYRSDFEDFSRLKRGKLRSTGGRAADEYLLDEDQFMFLGTLLKNTKKVVAFKKAIILQFKQCRKELQNLNKHQQKPEYHITRDAGKIVRRQTTDVMQQFIEYAKEQGSQNPDNYYRNITTMLNALLFIVEGKHKNLRNLMSIQQLMTVSSAEHIIERGLIEGMNNKKFYKDIFQDIKSRVKVFAELHGQSEILDEQFKIEA
jgi:hypothetical protein